jgi:hypothetical protein
LHQAIEEHSDSLQNNLQAQEALAQEELSREEQKEKQECHQLFRLTSSDKDTTYEWYKGRVENRVEDTCMWFLNHDHFKKMARPRFWTVTSHSRSRMWKISLGKISD